MAVAAVAVAMAVAANTTDVFHPAEVKCTKINSLYFMEQCRARINSMYLSICVYNKMVAC